MRLTIPVGNTAMVFRAGHRLRVEVSSSNFPHWDRNTNSGNIPITDGYSEVRVATQVLFHDQRYPSHVVLPTL
jgi:predicted acyl esterase